MSARTLTVSEALRKAILESAHSQYEIAKATGVSESALSRFVTGKRGFTLETVDTLATFLGLSLLATHKASRMSA